MIYRKAVLAVALGCAALPSAADAKAPAAEDEAALQRIITRIYDAYTVPVVNGVAGRSDTEDHRPGAAIDGYRPALSPRLAGLLERWWTEMKRAQQVYALNDFDWYCQCQDSDNATARLVSQRFWAVSQNRIDVIVHFSPGLNDGQDTGSPLVFRFRRQQHVWKLDDLKFDDSTTLRDGLAQDVRDARRDLANNKQD